MSLFAPVEGFVIVVLAASFSAIAIARFLRDARETGDRVFRAYCLLMVVAVPVTMIILFLQVVPSDLVGALMMIEGGLGIFLSPDLGVRSRILEVTE